MPKRVHGTIRIRTEDAQKEGVVIPDTPSPATAAFDGQQFVRDLLREQPNASLDMIEILVKLATAAYTAGLTEGRRQMREEAIKAADTTVCFCDDYCTCLAMAEAIAKAIQALP